MFDKILTYFIFSIFVLLAYSASAQENRYVTTQQSFTKREGLASQIVNFGLQDRNGFVWLATANGLQRFDGKNFLLFTKEKNNLQDNNILQIAEDENDCMWIFYGKVGEGFYSDGRCDILDLKNFKITTLANKFGKDLPFDASHIYALTTNEKNEIFIAISTNRLEATFWLYNKQSSFRKIGNDQFVKATYKDSVILIQRDNNAVLKIASNGKLLATHQSNLPNEEIGIIGMHDDGSYTLSFDRTIETRRRVLSTVKYVKLDCKNEAKPAPYFFDNLIGDYAQLNTTIHQNSKSAYTLLKNTQKGILLYDGKQYLTLIDKATLQKLSIQTINCYFRTVDNKHWICTEQGLFSFQLQPNNFIPILTKDVIKFPFSSQYQSRSIYADTSGVYVKCWQGLNKATRGINGVYKVKTILEAKADDFPDGFYCDGSDIWITGRKSGLHKYNLASSKITTHQGQNLQGLWCGFTTKTANIIIGHTYGLERFENNAFKGIKNCDSTSMVNSWVYKFMTTSAGELWAVTSAGIYKIDEQQLCVTARYHSNSEIKQYEIPFTDLHDVYEDKNEVFWLATNGNGLVKWDKRNQSYEQFTTVDGLSSNVLYAVLPDERGNLWLSSEYGLMRFDTTTKSVKTFTTDDGLPGNEFNRTSFFKAQDGMMYFGGLTGVVAINPASIAEQGLASNIPFQVINFNQFNAKTNKLEDRTIDLVQQRIINLLPGDKFFTIEFQLLDYSQSKNTYAYYIEGIDNSWIYTSDNSLRISGLPYGKYTLHIKAQNLIGEWSKQEIAIPLLVATPFYLQKWVLVSAVMLIIFCIWLLFRWRTLNLQKQNLNLTLKVKERTNQLESILDQKLSLLNDKDVLLKEIHHRVKNNLQVISSLLELQGKSEMSKEAQYVLLESQNRISSIALIHQNLYQGENIQSVSIAKFTHDLFSQMEHIYANNKLKVFLHSTIPTLELDIDTTVPLGLILNELMTNSFKYAFIGRNEGYIVIEIKYNAKGHYQLIYSDSGKGLPVGFDISKSTSLGMQLISDLARQIGGRMMYDTNKKTFTFNFTDREQRKLSD